MVARELRHPAFPVDSPAGDERAEGAGDSAARLKAIVEARYDFVWRTVVHFGVPEANAEDAAQRVLCVLARRIDDVVPGAELAFLFSTALRVAREARRSARRRPETSLEDLDALVANGPSPEEVLDERRARDVLRRVLDAIPDDLRQVFVLFELEELTVAEAAAVVGIPVGTAASRLRRARAIFRAIVRRMHAARDHRGTGGRL